MTFSNVLIASQDPGHDKSGSIYAREAKSCAPHFVERGYLHACLASTTNHLQVWTAVMTTSSSLSLFCRLAGEEPVESSGRSDQSSSAQNCDPQQVAGISGITGTTAACRLSLQPLPLSQPFSGENFTTNGKNKITVKATRISGELPPGSLSPQLATSKPVENISSGSKPRRFAPQLVETTRRRRKSGDPGPTILLHDKTDVSPGIQRISFRSLKFNTGSGLPLPSENSSIVSTADALSAVESRYSSSSLKKKESRQHSFRVPELPPIQSTGDSEESNESNCPSISTTPLAASADNGFLQQATEHRRKIVREESEGYLLALAAQAAENKLREQAMAAYPNEKTHEPIDHFAAAREDGDSVDKTHAQGHSKTISVMEDQRTLARSEMILPRASQAEAARDQNHVAGGPSDTEAGTGNIQGLETRKAVSPPLAGQDLQYPFCQSPVQTRFDAGQIYQDRELTEFDLDPERSGLWTPEGSSSRKGSTPGLWMGTCAKSAEGSRTRHGGGQTGLLTPAGDGDDEPIRFPRCHHDEFLLSPPDSDDDSKPRCTTSAASSTSIESQISEEFHDGFITQVYNYLSLGYPSMARKFDPELSKIAQVPVEALRLHDGDADANGYVGVPERIGVGKQRECPRWAALREYVNEWARQQSRIGGMGGGNGEWGNVAKKGSWAV